MTEHAAGDGTDDQALEPLHPDLTDPDPPEADARREDAMPSGSLLGRVRQHHDALTKKRTLEKAIPGYGGDLVAVYKPVDWEIIDGITERARKSSSKRADLLAACDILAQTCDHILVRDHAGEHGPAGNLVSVALAEELRERIDPDTPVRYDPNLAAALQITGRSAREVIIALFRADLADSGNDVLLMNHQGEVVDWIRQAESEADGDF